MNYRVLVADEAIEDIFGLVRYIHVDLCNPGAAEKLYDNLNREVKEMGDFPLKYSDSGMKYRDHIIHKRVYSSYLIFYMIDSEKKEVCILRVLKDLMDWQAVLDRTKIYHFPDHRE